MKNYIEYYDIKQATTLCGYDSAHMIDYLCREELIEPSASKGRGRGRKRFFTFKDLLILKLYKRLFDAGVSVRKLKQALKESEEFNSLEVSRTGLKNKLGEANILFTDGVKVYVREERGQFIQAGSDGQFVFSFMVSLQDLHHQIALETLGLPKYKMRLDGKTFYREAVS